MAKSYLWVASGGAFLIGWALLNEFNFNSNPVAAPTAGMRPEGLRPGSGESSAIESTVVGTAEDRVVMMWDELTLEQRADKEKVSTPKQLAFLKGLYGKKEKARRMAFLTARAPLEFSRRMLETMASHANFNIDDPDELEKVFGPMRRAGRGPGMNAETKAALDAYLAKYARTDSGDLLALQAGLPPEDHPLNRSAQALATQLNRLNAGPELIRSAQEAAMELGAGSFSGQVLLASAFARSGQPEQALAAVTKALAGEFDADGLWGARERELSFYRDQNGQGVREIAENLHSWTAERLLKGVSVASSSVYDEFGQAVSDARGALWNTSSIGLGNAGLDANRLTALQLALLAGESQELSSAIDSNSAANAYLDNIGESAWAASGLQPYAQLKSDIAEDRALLDNLQETRNNLFQGEDESAILAFYADAAATGERSALMSRWEAAGRPDHKVAKASAAVK